MNKQNLMIVAKHLLSGEWKKSGFDFDMNYFLEKKLGCGCAVGHATLIPELGGCVVEVMDAYVKWSIDVFELGNSNEWAWCFGSDWSQIDNTAEGAGRRILYLVQNDGAPAGFCRDLLDHAGCYLEGLGEACQDDFELVSGFVKEYQSLSLPDSSVDIMSVVREFSEVKL